MVGLGLVTAVGDPLAIRWSEQHRVVDLTRLRRLSRNHRKRDGHTCRQPADPSRSEGHQSLPASDCKPTARATNALTAVTTSSGIAWAPSNGYHVTFMPNALSRA